MWYTRGRRKIKERRKASEKRYCLSLAILGVIQQNGGVQSLLHQLERALPYFLFPIRCVIAPGADAGRDLEDVHGPDLAEGAFHHVFCEDGGGRKGGREGGRREGVSLG